MPKLTVPMNRANPFFERDATGWQFIDARDGRVMMDYNLYDNKNRRIGFDPASGGPADSEFQDPQKRIPPQDHY